MEAIWGQTRYSAVAGKGNPRSIHGQNVFRSVAPLEIFDPGPFAHATRTDDVFWAATIWSRPQRSNAGVSKRRGQVLH